MLGHQLTPTHMKQLNLTHDIIRTYAGGARVLCYFLGLSWLEDGKRTEEKKSLEWRECPVLSCSLEWREAAAGHSRNTSTWTDLSHALTANTSTHSDMQE
ncbi:hypothetical protein I3760_12G022000 [Carya illinoinensis]|uniref:Uncharacterized protein n=1 Tax=Carya illinoinensis TaxID=32201 RepID=A0A922E5P9_CARIL|nr:hypothetical protein I3760_12G022000 [Carya illinoinensis]KAG6696165.1 hypothetical protein I3842_09G134400 [Carya illinoinensis]